MTTNSDTQTHTVTHDLEAGMGYVQILHGRKIAKTVDKGKTINDYDTDGNLIGYEFYL